MTKYEELEAQARQRGREHGARDADNGYHNDAPLSGEWAGESIPELLGDILDEIADYDGWDWIMEAYEQGYYETNEAPQDLVHDNDKW